MKKVFWPLIISIALSLGILLGGFVVSSSFRSRGIYTNSNKIKLNKLIDFIEHDYVDDVNTDSIVDRTVTSILEQLDPHSVYIGKSDMQSVTESMKGEFVGVGIKFYIYNDTLAVIKEVANGPAEKGGILPGDRILYADNNKLFGENMPNDSIISFLRGRQGTNVALEVYRKIDNKRFTVNLTREKIPLKSIDVGMKLDNGIGYIKINRFSESTYSEFYNVLEELKKQNITGLLLDLRENGGGYMDQAIKILDEFLDKDYVIVKTINKKGKEVLTKSTANGIYTTGPLYVLVDENSASASEIIAGAIQDNDRGTIVGRRTFGKGLVQRELLLGDGSAIRLTTARYYTPSGRSIQKPYNNGLAEYNNDFLTRYESGELYAADSIKIADSLQYKTLKGRIVYGGGGIVPDLFVPIGTKHGDNAVTLLMQSGIVNYFVFEVIDQDRKKFDQMTQNELVAYIKSNGIIFDEFRKYISRGGLNFSLNKYKDLIEFFLIAEFINQLDSEQAYYRWLMREDLMLKSIEKYKE